jgi:hypothetical protein
MKESTSAGDVSNYPCRDQVGRSRRSLPLLIGRIVGRDDGLMEPIGLRIGNALANDDIEHVSRLCCDGSGHHGAGARSRRRPVVNIAFDARRAIVGNAEELGVAARRKDEDEISSGRPARPPDILKVAATAKAVACRALAELARAQGISYRHQVIRFGLVDLIACDKGRSAQRSDASQA